MPVKILTQNPEQNMIITPFSGGCACGAIRYECSAEPLVMLNCHCRDCQRATGGAFFAVVYMSANAFTLTKGSLGHYLTPSMTRGHNKRGFCPECGSPISVAESAKGIGINAASLDDPSWFRAQLDLFTSDAQPWGLMDPKLPKFPFYSQ